MTTDLTACVQIELEPAFIQASIGAPTGRRKALFLRIGNTMHTPPIDKRKKS